MTNGIGNPDWQRRYIFSAVPLFDQTLPTDVSTLTANTDANGYSYIVLNVVALTSASFFHVTVNWYLDQAASFKVAAVDTVVGPNGYTNLKVPAMARFFKLSIAYLSGTTGGTGRFTVYGTTSDTPDLLGQTTTTPMVSINASLGAGASQQVLMGNTYGGRVFATFNHAGNNKWTAWFEYYDNTTQAFVIYYNVRGLDKGQSWSEQVWLPFAPVRVNMRNDDTVAQITQLYMITANTP